MRNLLWESFENIGSLVQNRDFGTVAEKVDSNLNASMEAIADILPTAAAPILRNGVDAARGALTALHSKTLTNRLSPDYAAGRLAAAVDILGYAASATADEDAVRRARQQPYARILDLLSEQPLRNTDIVVRIAKDKAQVSRLLDELREMGMITSHRHGRDLFNGLTPVGRLLVEEGVEARQRSPLAESRVAAFGAYDLGNLPTPEGTKQSQLPRLSVAGKR